MHSPTYKHGNYTQLMQIKLFSAKPQRNCNKILQNDQVQKDVKTHQI